MRARLGAWRHAILAGLASCGLGLGVRAQDAPAPAPASAPPVAAAAPKLRIVTTFCPIYCFTKNVAGELAEVAMLVPEKTRVQDFSPAAEDLRRLAEADVVVENGFSLEPWLDRLVPRGLKPGALRIVAGRGVPPIPAPSADPLALPASNSHVWLDPLLAITELQNIRDGLMARDPAHADAYLANENQYEAALRDLDTEIGDTMVNITKRRLLCAGDAFAYFLARYEFTLAAQAAPPTGGAWTAADRDALGRQAASTQAQAMLFSTPLPTGARKAILNEIHLPIVIADPMESGPASASAYEDGTRANARAFQEALP